MASVSATRSYEVGPETVRSAVLQDVGTFVESSGFDSVTVAGDTYTVSRRIGIATLELVLERVASDQLLAFEQTEGIFDRMWTEYRVAETAGGCELHATTEFELGGVLGPVLDNTVIKRQRREEFEKQFAYVADMVDSTSE